MSTDAVVHSRSGVPSRRVWSPADARRGTLVSESAPTVYLGCQSWYVASIVIRRAGLAGWVED